MMNLWNLDRFASIYSVVFANFWRKRPENTETKPT